MLIPNKLSLIKKLTTSIIAPHGMTDLVHANQNNLMSELFEVNLLSTFTSILLYNLDLDIILNTGLVIASIIHFRHDMPEINNIPRYILSALFLVCAIPLIDLFMIYMIFVHVPHHYMMNISYLKTQPILTSILILVSSIIFYEIGININDVFNNNLIIDISKGLIISHIIYGEKYIYNNI